jgi:hypothetical protein
MYMITPSLPIFESGQLDLALMFWRWLISADVSNQTQLADLSRWLELLILV